MLVGLFGWMLRPRIREPGRLSLFPGKSGFPQRRARHRPGRCRGAGVSVGGPASVLVSRVPAGEHPGLPAVHLYYTDRSAAVALERM